VDTTNNWVKLARHFGLDWRVARVPVWPAPPIGRSTSLALDKKGNRRISLSTNGDLGIFHSQVGGSLSMKLTRREMPVPTPPWRWTARTGPASPTGTPSPAT
jgi:hypothetical protein